jgi:hypothetical protein
VETVYDRLGARPVVNCRGVYSELGGAIISPDVWAKMTEAAGMAASMSELLEATGRRLAQLLGAEAARVIPGAAAAIALGTAACLTRGDGAAAERLPDTADLPAEVLLQRVQRPNYKYARVIWTPSASPPSSSRPISTTSRAHYRCATSPPSPAITACRPSSTQPSSTTRPRA